MIIVYPRETPPHTRTARAQPPAAYRRRRSRPHHRRHGDHSPTASQRYSNLHIQVVGANKIPPAILELNGSNSRVFVHGYVPELRPLYARMRLSVAPLRWGAGVKGKINTAHQLGVPVVRRHIYRHIDIFRRCNLLFLGSPATLRGCMFRQINHKVSLFMFRQVNHLFLSICLSLYIHI